jgi:hypothetical protein
VPFLPSSLSIKHTTLSVEHCDDQGSLRNEGKGRLESQANRENQCRACQPNNHDLGQQLRDRVPEFQPLISVLLDEIDKINFHIYKIWRIRVSTSQAL